MDISVLYNYISHDFCYDHVYLAIHLHDDIIECIKEHWLYEWVLLKLNNFCSNYKCRPIATSSINADKGSKLGCSYGGLTIFDASVFDTVLIDVSSNKRV